MNASLDKRVGMRARYGLAGDSAGPRAERSARSVARGFGMSKSIHRGSRMLACSRVERVSRSRVRGFGTSLRSRQPATPFVAGFVGSANVINGLVIGGHVQFGEQMLDGESSLGWFRRHGLRAAPRRKAVAQSEWWLELPGHRAAHSRSGLGIQGVARAQRRSEAGRALPNDQIRGIRDGSTVYVDLHATRRSSPPGKPAVRRAGADVTARSNENLTPDDVGAVRTALGDDDLVTARPYP